MGLILVAFKCFFSPLVKLVGPITLAVLPRLTTGLNNNRLGQKKLQGPTVKVKKTAKLLITALNEHEASKRIIILKNAFVVLLNDHQSPRISTLSTFKKFFSYKLPSFTL